MKLFIVLALVAYTNAAKLDRAYLPPNYAATSGGSGNFLQTPVNNYQGTVGFNNGVAGNIRQANNYQNNGGYGQNAAGFEQNAGGFVQNGNNFVQNDEYSQNYNGFNNFGNTEARPERPRAAIDRNAAILRSDNQNDGESYAYAYETENGIIAEENGIATNGVEAQGGYSYTGDDGQVYTVRYTAGVNGFVPEGDHLPTPPPIPEEILKVLEQNARDEAAGIYDDGSYNENKYGVANGNYNNLDNGNNDGYNYNGNNVGNNYNGNNVGSNYNGNNPGNTYNDERIGDDEDSIVTTNALFRSGARPAAGNQAPVFNQGFKKQGPVDNSYIPPFERSQPINSFGNQGPNGFNQVVKKQNQAIRNQGFNQAGNYNQATRDQSYQGRNEVENAYLPPFGRNVENQGSQGPAYNSQNRSFGIQGPKNGVTNAYLPPTNQRSPSFGNQGPKNEVTNAYLPPSNQRSPSFGRRQPNFNARNGYQY